MARMWGLSHHGRCLGGGLLGGCLALVLTAGPAVAELSSVDAYGGQAQVLGKPIHRHVRSGGSPAQGSGREGGQGAGTSGSQAGGGGTASSGSGSHASTSGAGTSATPSAAGGAAGGGAASQGSGAENAHRGGNGATSTTANGASGALAGAQGRPVALADSAAVSNGSLSLSALDVLLLLAVFAGLAAVGVGIRRWSRQGE